MSLPATDDFSVDNFAVNWVVMTGTAVAISGAAYAGAAVGGTSYARWSADSFADDHYAQIETTFISTFDYGGGSVRLTGSAGTSCGYLSVYGQNNAILYRIDNGALTNIGSLTLLTGTGTRTLKLTATGTSLQPSIGGVDDGAPVTDATYATGAAGIFLFSTLAELSSDNFIGDNLGGAAGFLLVKN